MLTVGDINHDQVLPEHVAKVDSLLQNFDLSQCSHPTHTHRRILDLVFDTSNSNTVSSLPSPYSDHFVFLPKSKCIIFLQNLAFKYLAFNPHYITHKDCVNEILWQS